MKVGQLLAHVEELEAALAADLRAAAERHRDDHDVYHQCHTFAATADQRVEALAPLKQRYEGKAVWSTALESGSADLLEDLRWIYLRSQEAAITCVGILPMRTVSRQAHCQQCRSANSYVFNIGHTELMIERPRFAEIKCGKVYHALWRGLKD